MDMILAQVNCKIRQTSRFQTNFADYMWILGSRVIAMSMIIMMMSLRG